MRILITGAAGFVGGHLIQHLQTTTPDAELHGTTVTGYAGDQFPEVLFHEIDLRDSEHVTALLDSLHPDQVYHLAAQAFVPRSFEAPWETLENNVRSQLNLLLATIALRLTPRMLVVSSAEIYGPVSPDELPIDESAPFRPTNPYSVSKVAQDMLAYQYHASHDLPLIRVRPFNHFGPGQSERFVAPAFAMQLARIEAGKQEPVIKVGDLTASRDFTDVRDIVRAYHLLMTRGTPGDVYNVASGTVHSAQEILDTLLQISGVNVEVEVDPERLRPVEVPINYGSPHHLQKQTGWKPEIPFEQSLSDILEDCRQRIKNQQGA